MHLAFATDRDHPDFAEDDRVLVTFLIDQGLRVSPAIWDNPKEDWQRYDAIIFRSVWDYFIKKDEFDDWLNQLYTLSVRIFNPLGVIHWNKNKTYLDRFKSLGVPIPEYQIVTSIQTQNLYTLLLMKDWQKAVIKPTISGGAYKTWVTDINLAKNHQAAFENLLAEQAVIVQKFSDEIIDHGEWSLIFFNKKFSHAVCKKAKPGEFRVQAQYGGQHALIHPTSELLRQVEQILNLVEEPLLYARVDGFLNKDSQFYLMELELIEPVLFFESDPSACKNFYTAWNERYR